ncbi:putative periplasmic serine endoprotease DegP-like precursor [Aquisphaera giovannonii]|uniref:Putative periplasmic serine endoprotease DegP-like n=1 Tax=Aquisphaera giovannonii TaxID=406548 RepID=A0A5B9W2L9_9BACT|nr:trypsin-like peptidase domain-containing protein [Aquisphaera giovannonii]QEH34321.1 putative periplasmic serine endoprotease DegP-like precursor [Aquisphaera giovannonii]
MSRSSSIALAGLSLAAGLVLGLSLGRGGRPVLAQVAGEPVGPKLGRPVAAERPAAGEAAGRRNDEAVYAELAREYDKFDHVNRIFALVSRAISPSVVHIVATKTTRHEEGQRTRRIEETGSGVIVRSDHGSGLYVLTNNHVVEGGKAAKIKIFLHDGRTIAPERVWSDPEADIAVLKLDRDDLPAARMGNSDTATVGTWVLAMGSPFGLMHSVSQGIISARSRHMDELEDVKNQDFLQTDAAINPGNSGGPLVNMKGEVVGINNSIASNGGGNEGVGFSIPINLARWIMNELIDHGRVTRGALGVELQPNFNQEDATNLGLDRPVGAWVDRVNPDSPAARAGLRDGDVVLKFGGVPIHDLNHLINTVSMTPVGRPADVVVWRDRREVSMQIMVGDRDRTITGPPTMPTERRPEPPDLVHGGRGPEIPTTATALGLDLTTLNRQMALRYRLPETLQGAVVVGIQPDSPLSMVCQLNDVVSKVNDHAVRSAEEAVSTIRERADHEILILTVDRRGREGMERYTIKVP